MDEEPLKTIMEAREALMVSPAGDSKPTLRTAHFLKPTTNSSDGSVSEALSSSASSVPPTFEPKEWPLTIHFKGWRTPPKKWVVWVDTLHPKYEPLWKKVGIFEAIMSTKCHILKAEDLALGVAEKWCPKTNTFVFPWGEATITLEDVMVLGGYPLLGEPVFTTLDDHKMKDFEGKLVLARREAGRSKQNKASISAWIDLFMNSGREIEHEAFLAAWLSTFVFSHGCLVRDNVFPIAVQLATGNTIALAPAVLASIYRDLGLLKRTIVGLTKTPVVGNDVRFEVTLRSPFYFVQIWVWERFKNLQPKPKLINSGDPILARWHKVKAMKVENVRVALNSAVEDFLWRPYARYASSKCRVFYPENEMLVPFGKDLDNEHVSFVTCLRVSELVGFGSVSLVVKQYLPHRVAMQFGMDQDIPASVPRFNKTRAIAWENYCRPISDTNLYFPSRLFEADVTPRYVQWWNQSVLSHMDPVKNFVKQKISTRPSNHRTQSSKAKKSGNDADVPPGFPPKRVSTVISGKSSEDDPKSMKGGNDADVPPGFLTKRLKACGTSVQDGSIANENFNADDVPIDCFPEHENMNTANSYEHCMPTVLAESNCIGMTRSRGKATIDEGKHLSSSSASTADSGAARKTLPQTKPVVIIVKDDSESSMEGLENDFEDDASGSKEQRLSCDKVSLAGTEDGGYSCSSEMNIVAELEERISRLERVITRKLK